MLESNQKISVGLLQPGVFVQLEGTWLDHPFLFSKFKLTSWEQVEILVKSGIKEVAWIPEKSDCLPREQDGPAAPDTSSIVSSEDDAHRMEKMWHVKREQMEHLKQLHDNIRRCTRNYETISKKVPDLMKKMSTGSREAIEGASKAVGGMVDTFLGDTDAIVHLINIKEKEEGIYHHSLNVSVLAIMLGKKANLSDSDMHDLGLAALLHDIGKSHIEKKILRKKGALNRAEAAIFNLHPQYGADILWKSGVRNPGVLQAVKEHHEYCDGTGYPSGLKGGRIGTLAKIITIVDLYDNLCNNPLVERPMTPFEALSHMYAKQHLLIDLDLFSIFIRSMGVFPPGTVVQLSTGEIGIVISINHDNPLRPSLLLYDANIPREEALICEMEKAEDVTIEKSIRINELPDNVRLYLSATPHVTYFIQKREDGR